MGCDEARRRGGDGVTVCASESEISSSSSISLKGDEDKRSFDTRMDDSL